MSVFHVLLKGVVVTVFVSLSTGLTAQLVTNGANISIQTGTTLTIQGGLTNEGMGSITNEGTMEVEGDLINNSTQNLSDGQGVVLMNGSAAQSIGGTNSSAISSLQIDNAAGITLNQDVSILADLELINGNLDLNGQFIVLSDTAVLLGETDAKRIFGSAGEIQITKDLGTPMGENIANLGIELTSSSNLGSTRISRGHAIQNIGGGSSIERYFDIAPANNSNLDATMRMYYFPSELNGQSPVSLNFFLLSPGATNWSPAWGTPDVPNNFVEQNGLQTMALWTLSDNGVTAIDDPRPVLSVSYFPNPMNPHQQLNLLGLEAGSYSFSLYDARGREVARKELTAFDPNVEVQVALPNLALGLYTIHVLSEKYQPMQGKLMIHQH